MKTGRLSAAMAAVVSLLALAGSNGTALAVTGLGGGAAPGRVGGGALKAPPRLPDGNTLPVPSGAVETAMQQRAQSAPAVSPATAGCPLVRSAPGRPDNVRANQDCDFFRQAEEWIDVNPRDPGNVIVSQNDSRTGGNRTGVDFSLDGGRHWGDYTPPNTRVPTSTGTLWSYDAFSDPAHTHDSRGNLFYAALGFDFLQDAANGIFVWRSNACFKGTFLHNPADQTCNPPPLSLDPASTLVVDNFPRPNVSYDKELIAADAFPSSPFRDNVYVTFTRFDYHCGSDKASFCESPIVFSRSTDGGATFSPPVEISGANAAVCRFGDAFVPRRPDACNFDQGSYPVVGPDGTVYVVFNNANRRGFDTDTGFTPRAQQLLVKSTDGGLHWSTPVHVADDYDDQPFALPDKANPPCDTFRQCLPPNDYRINDYPSMGIDATTGKLAVFWSDFRNGGPCATDAATKLPTEPCKNHDNDVFSSVSTDGGRTWGRTRLVSRGTAPSAQWQNWGDVGENGALYVGAYDRSYGTCERTGCNDITLFKSTDDGATWTRRRITTSSMPNLTCDDNPFQCGFLGDYMSIQYRNGTVHLTWADTRGRNGAPDEDVYYARVRG